MVRQTRWALRARLEELQALPPDVDGTLGDSELCGESASGNTEVPEEHCSEATIAVLKSEAMEKIWTVVTF